MNNVKTSIHNVHTSLTRPIPRGVCCKVAVPDEIKNIKLDGIVIRMMTKDNLDLMKGFRLYLTSRDKANDYHLDHFDRDGPELEASMKELGYMQYDLQLHQEYHLEDNKDYLCKHYSQVGGYNKCLHDHYVQKSLRKVQLKSLTKNTHIFLVF